MTDKQLQNVYRKEIEMQQAYLKMQKEDLETARKKLISDYDTTMETCIFEFRENLIKDQLKSVDFPILEAMLSHLDKVKALIEREIYERV